MSPVMSLNARQQLAYQAILEGKSIFLTGSGGTGKSYLLSSVYDTFKREGKRGISLTALTGCAALLLHPTARTLHSWAGIGLGQFSAETLIEKTKRNRRAVMRWKMTDCLVIDEVSMMTPELFEKLDAVGRAIRKRPEPFGGLQLVLVGDFFQLPPVMRGETMFVFESRRLVTEHCQRNLYSCWARELAWITVGSRSSRAWSLHGAQKSMT